MRTLTILSIAAMISGCAAPKSDRNIVRATGQIQSARVDLEKAKAASARATVQIASGKTLAAELRKTATKQQFPHVTRLETALEEVSKENTEITGHIVLIEKKLEQAQHHVDKAQNTITDLREKNARYQRLKLWIMLFAGVGAAYVAFRMVPPIGPARYYATAGAAVIAATLVYTFL